MLKSPKEAGAHGEDGDEQEKNHQGKQDSGMGLTARAPASDSHRGSPLLGAQAAGPGGGELTESGGRSGPVFRLCRLGCEGWQPVEGRESQGLGDAEPGAGRRRRRRRRVAPSGRRRAGAGPGPGGGALPRPRRPPPARMRAGDGNPVPRSARLHLRIWGAGPRVPRAPSPSPGLPAERSRPWKRTRCPAKRALTRIEAAPGAGRPRTSAREGAAALRCAALRRLRRPPSALHRRPGSDFLFLGLGPAARPRSPLGGRAPTRPSRRRDAGPAAASSGSAVPPPLCPGENGGEVEGEREGERD
ncbi:proline-rich protein HaeIII subfamily 1-like [Monodon monoceros]|uniref:proline-rich protein HaeIII subfamily 1-like n=1 Tax=Monodon monoceros TaxID=40151 RepID=UPI0010F6FA31|nr:proline-rich protein HaeIII subfamily 1-like [Monodon monoceros]